MNILVIFSLLCISYSTAQRKLCRFSINTDMQSKAPMFISVVDKKSFLLPRDKDGIIKMENGKRLYLACPGTTNYVDGYGSKKMVLAECDDKKNFYVDGRSRSVPISDIECKYYPIPYTKPGKACASSGKGKLIEIGFQFETQKNAQITLCFDTTLLKTYWATTSMLGAVSFSCPVGSIAFSDAYFGNVDPDQRYVQQGSRMPDNFTTGGDSFEKGHLVAKCDYMDSARKRMTYFYVNTGPQWRTFNNGNWKSLEYRVRQAAVDKATRFRVHTGNHETLVLRNKRITLEKTGKMPAPLYFWKIVINTKDGKGVAFVGVNDPFNTYNALCTVMCSQIGWLGDFQEKRKDKSKGYVYCCTIETLQRISNIELPDLPDYTGGVLV